MWKESLSVTDRRKITYVSLVQCPKLKRYLLHFPSSNQIRYILFLSCLLPRNPSSSYLGIVLVDLDQFFPFSLLNLICDLFPLSSFSTVLSSIYVTQHINYCVSRRRKIRSNLIAVLQTFKPGIQYRKDYEGRSKKLKA